MTRKLPRMRTIAGAWIWLNPGLCSCGAAETEPRIPDMATTFPPEPVVSALQLCGWVILSITEKGELYKHFAGLKRKFFWQWGIWLQQKKTCLGYFCHLTGTLRGILESHLVSGGKKVTKPCLHSESGNGGLLSAKGHKSSLPCF